MSALASGVVLVTCWVGDRPWGMTVTAFASVSAEPPTVLVSLGSETTSARAIAATRQLRRQHPRARTARRRPLRLGAGRGQVPRAVHRARRPASSDSPVVAGALAHLDCELVRAGSGRRPHRPLRPRSGRTASSQRDAAPLPPPRLPDARDRAPDAHRLKGASDVSRVDSQNRAGERLVALAETLADEIGPRAADHDRDGELPLRQLRRRQAERLLRRADPRELGGLGVDIRPRRARRLEPARPRRRGADPRREHAPRLRAQRRPPLADRDGSRRRATRSRRSATTLEQIARDGTVFAAAAASRGRTSRGRRRPRRAPRRLDRLRPQGVLHDGARRRRPLHGRHLHRRRRRERYGYAMVPRETPGVVVHDDWDALGMRASGSHSVSFENVRLPPSALRGGFPVGDAVEYMERNLDAGLFHAAAALGIAESAHASVAARSSRGATSSTRTRRCSPRESVVDLSACRARLLARRRADRRAPRGATRRRRGTRRGADRTVRGGAERESLHRRRGGPHRRPGARALRRRRLPERQPARPRLPRRPRRRRSCIRSARTAPTTFLGQLAAGREPRLH